VNKLRGGLKVCAVKSPGFGDNRKNTMQDIAIATGGQFISEEVGLQIETSEITILGTAKKVIITKDDTIIMGGAGLKEDVKERVDMIGE
jgi:chaperonin GroEL